ncbi:hypothetical protein [Gilliamella intestini]|uniref:Uncharacterized protein n=1 Tax=Gilliamella intestini TaxID=1798183 RepID=A0A1C4DS71_9GAMM|nr:hypothetical protein [Gilliamella intestini]SCC34173.1 hypothetical protein GA0061080_11011 [Gilliamella intestini]
MKGDIYKQAKEIFFKYQGNSFFMEQDYLYKTFKNYNVPQNVLADWYKELLRNNKEQLLCASNNKEIKSKFFIYLELIRCNKQYFSNNDIEFAFDFFRKNKGLDDFSKIIMVEIIIKFIKQQNIIDTSIKEYCKVVLTKINTDSFTVDESYKYHGELPSYTLKENVSSRVLEDLEQIANL